MTAVLMNVMKRMAVAMSKFKAGVSWCPISKLSTVTKKATPSEMSAFMRKALLKDS